MEILKIRGITKKFGGLTALKGVNLTAEEGEIIGLIGANGAGKTTLLNVIAGIYVPELGTIEYQAENITGLRADQICKKGIARTFQLMKPFRELSVLENVMVGSFLRTDNAREAEEIARGTLKLFGLAEKGNISSAKLTSIEQRLLAVARAMATKPRLLLLDEAMAGLNPKESKEAIAVIREIQVRESTTFICVEHNMEAIMSISNRIVVLNFGTKIAEGSPREIANNEEIINIYLGKGYEFKN
jgi:branched-chain amino acid transport system ATP-binding protein